MNARRLLIPLLTCALALSALPAFASEEGQSTARGPGFFSRVFGFFHFWHRSAEKDAPRGATWRHLTLTMLIEPAAVKLPDTHQLKVTLQLTNKSRRFVQLEFPNTQRVEVLLKTATGKLVEQWSEDRNFASEPGMVSVNPGERLEYTALLSTRDMKPGESYVIEGFFPSYEALRATKTVKAER